MTARWPVPAMDTLGGAPVRQIAKLVHITPISLWFMADITILNGVYKPTIDGHLTTELSHRVVQDFFHTRFL